MDMAQVKYFKPDGISGLELLSCPNVNYLFPPHFHQISAIRQKIPGGNGALVAIITAVHSVRIQRQQLLSMDERLRKYLAIRRIDAERLAGRYRTAENDSSKRGAKRWKK